MVLRKKIQIEFKNKSFFALKEKCSHLFAKGYGSEYNKQTIVFSLYETLYLLGKKKIVIHKKEEEITSKHLEKRSDFIVKEYIVYRDLRDKGHIVRSGLKYGSVFRVYKKGDKYGKSHALWLVEPHLESEKVKMKEISGKNRIAHSTRKKMLIAIVDVENDVTYLEQSWLRL